MIKPSFLSQQQPWLIGVVHLPPLPGSPRFSISIEEISKMAVHDGHLIEESGMSAVILENFQDSPFRKDRVDPETIAAMAVITSTVSRELSIPVGINILRNDALAALSVAACCGGQFLRVNVLAGSVATDQGIVEGKAADLLRRRDALAADVAILADVDVKHATALDTRPLTVQAQDLVHRSGADAVLVTGQGTGKAVDMQELESVAEAVRPTPTLAASGTTPASLPSVLQCCAGAIVGTAVQDPQTHRVDPVRLAAYVKAASS